MPKITKIVISGFPANSSTNQSQRRKAARDGEEEEEEEQGLPDFVKLSRVARFCETKQGCQIL